jgi:hypothetical protein
LEQKETKTGIKLAFPKDYESLVGNFCKTLGIPVDEMPALVLINSAEDPENNPPYWSFAGDPESGSRMLMSIVGDMQFATFNAPMDLHGRQWREAVIKLMFKRSAGRFVKRVSKTHAGKIVSAVKTAISKLSFSPAA